MLHELQHEFFSILPPIFHSADHRLVIRSIALGHNPARAWIDDRINPTTALVWDTCGGLYVAGQAQHQSFLTDLRTVILDTVIPDALGRWIPEMELYYDIADWEPAMKNLLPGELNPRTALLSTYQFADAILATSVETPPGFSILPIDHALLAQRNLAHYEDLNSWIDSFFESPDDFLRISFGHVAIAEAEQAIASLCIAVFAAPDDLEIGHKTTEQEQYTPRMQYELGLATAAEYRRRGLANAVAAASVLHCHAGGHTPVWHCWADNTASVHVAENVGFQLLHQTPALRFQTGADR